VYEQKRANKQCNLTVTTDLMQRYNLHFLQIQRIDRNDVILMS